MIERVIYARLYAMERYENERFEVVAIVQDGDVDAAFDEARATVEAQYARFVAERQPKSRAKQSNYIQPLPQPDVLPAPATAKQLRYIGQLQDDLAWTSEQLAAYAAQQDVNLVTMSMRQASAFIDGMKRLATESSERPPVDNSDIPF